MSYRDRETKIMSYRDRETKTYHIEIERPRMSYRERPRHVI